MAKTALKTTEKPTKSAKLTVPDALQYLLKDTYATYLLTHNYHWNVEGPKFVSLHTLFETQYTELFAAIDEIAERIRALDVYALPNHYSEIIAVVDTLSSPLLKVKNKDAAADLMVKNLITVHEKVVASAQKAKHVADDMDDEESEDLAISRIQIHQKALWMLRSIIK
ncbi:MAG: DNA starvation/stationary phase protection protein [Rickettsiales bacterium]|nr:DNA starvation/stationary phase protection protein [Rickettsiales bacterium]